MAPRKKIHKEPADRMRAVRARREAEGKRQVTIWLAEETIEKLDNLGAAKGQTRAEVIERLIAKAK